MFEKVIEGYIAQGLKDFATDARLSASLFEVLPEEERARALKWVQNNIDKTQVVLGFRREVPTSPIISVTPSSEVETDPPVGALGEQIIDSTTGQRVNHEGSWFECSYRCLAQSINADEVTYLASITRQTLLRYRQQLNTAGLVEQKISLTDLMPSEDFNDPNIEVFQRGVELSGTAFIGYDAVQPDPAPYIPADVTVTEFISPNTTTIGGVVFEFPAETPDTDTFSFTASRISDTFIRDDNTTLLRTTSGSLWSALSGTWGIVNDTAYLVTAGADHRSLAVVTSVANGRVAMTVDSSPVGARLAFRFTDKDNGFYVEAQSNQYALLKVLGGVISTIGTYSATPQSGDQIMASLVNSAVSIFVNGHIALTVSQAFNQAGTLHGIGATDTCVARWSSFAWT